MVSRGRSGSGSWDLNSVRRAGGTGCWHIGQRVVCVVVVVEIEVVELAGTSSSKEGVEADEHVERLESLSFSRSFSLADDSGDSTRAASSASCRPYSSASSSRCKLLMGILKTCSLCTLGLDLKARLALPGGEGFETGGFLHSGFCSFFDPVEIGFVPLKARTLKLGFSSLTALAAVLFMISLSEPNFSVV